MKKIVIFLSISFLIIFVGLFFLVSQFIPEVVPVLKKFPKTEIKNSEVIRDKKINIDISKTSEAERESSVVINSPDLKNELDTIFTLKGSVPGEWFSDNILVIKLLDANGKKIAVSYAKSEGIWTKDSQVSFSAEFEYISPQIKNGSIVFVDGKSKNQDIILVKFK